MSRDSRAKTVAAELGVSYTSALRLIQNYCAELNGPMTSREIVTGVINDYQLKRNVGLIGAPDSGKTTLLRNTGADVDTTEPVYDGEGGGYDE